MLAIAVALDLAFGDPVYALHPIRLIGRSLAWYETTLRKLGAEGYFGGIVLFFLLAVTWVGGTVAFASALRRWNSVVVFMFYLFWVYSCLALHDLVRHAWSVELAARRGDLHAARAAISMLVGRDTDKMDIAACRRAAIESLSENLTDGFVSPLFWYVTLGPPGIILFKLVSTMDSMVGYKTPRYIRFGWCGARLDDVMNFLPARLTWLCLSLLCFVLPNCSGRKAFLIGWRQHSILPGPNSGWSEAAIAGAMERKLLGPIWARGSLVTDVWLGEPSDCPAGDRTDVPRAQLIVIATGLFFAALAVLLCRYRV